MIDPYFLRHLSELAAFEDEIKSAGNIGCLQKDLPFFRQIKELGYSDKQLAFLLDTTENVVRQARYAVNLFPAYSAVDTCAGEFEAITPYYYSTFHGNEKHLPSGKRSFMILGGGPNRIGQGIEFDYCCCHGAFALRQAGYEVVMVNSNPETVSSA